MSRRPLLLAGAVAGAGALAVTSLAVLGSTTGTAEADGWAGWTGRVDSGSVSDRAAMTPDDAVAVSLLERSAAVSSKVAYSGRAVTLDRSGTVTTDLLHVPGRGTLARVVGGPVTQARFAPDGRSGSFADDGRQLTLLRVNYRVLRQADLDTTVAGRPADAVTAVDADGVVAARYWLDHATGLLLRKELVDSDGAVWSRAGFETFTLDADSDEPVPEQTADAWSEELDDAGLRAARQAGCLCPESLPGGLTLLDARRAPSGAVAETPVVHQLFSDGLVSVSLFSLDGTVSESDAEGLLARGFTRTELDGRYAWVRGASDDSATATVVWVCHDSVLTLVTDDAQDPIATATAVLAALPPDADPVDTSLGGRIVRGWERITGSAA